MLKCLLLINNQHKNLIFYQMDLIKRKIYKFKIILSSFVFLFISDMMNMNLLNKRKDKRKTNEE